MGGTAGSTDPAGICELTISTPKHRTAHPRREASFVKREEEEFRASGITLLPANDRRTRGNGLDHQWPPDP